MDWHSGVRFSGESTRYRTAREKLLAAERDLRKQVEQVARLRRKLPVGGVVPEDYIFDQDHAATVRLSDLFQPGLDTFLDSLDGVAPHLSQRINLAVVGKSPITRIVEFARLRGWSHLRLLSSAGNTYNHDYHSETADGAQLPVLTVFVKHDGKIAHFYSTELLYTKPEHGQDERHIDMMWPLWNLLDITPEGRGENWYPRLTYQS